MRTLRRIAPVCALLATSCYNPDEHIVPKDIGTEFRLTATSRDSLLADGASTRVLVAYVPQQATPEGRKIRFATTSGLFADANAKTVEVTAEVNADSLRIKGIDERIAKATLIGGLSPGRTTVSAVAAGITRELAIPLSRALPEHITASTNSFFVRPGYKKEVNITATLTRSTGKPSLNSRVSFRAIDGAGAPIGRFRDIDDTSDEQGKCSATYGLLDSTRTGRIRVITSGTYRGKFLADTAMLDILK